jgi:hypothetical protein
MTVSTFQDPIGFETCLVDVEFCRGLFLGAKKGRR